MNKSKFRRKCKCGFCDKYVKSGKKFICGHNLRVISEDSERKRIKSLTGRKHSEETKRKISEGNRGKIVSEETKRKISEGNRGKKRSLELKQKMSIQRKGRKRILSEKGRKKISELMKDNQYAKGHIHSDKTKKIISKAHKGKKLSEEHKRKISTTLMILFQEEGNPNWKGGKKFTLAEYCDAWLDKEYKQSIRDRDNNECQNPNCKGNCKKYFLNIHHIDYNKKNCIPDNLITLCHSCNSRANANRDMHTKLYQEIICK